MTQLILVITLLITISWENGTFLVTHSFSPSSIQGLYSLRTSVVTKSLLCVRQYSRSQKCRDKVGKGWGDSSVHKTLGTLAWGPDWIPWTNIKMLGVVVHTHNPSAGEMKTGISPRLPGQPDQSNQVSSKPGRNHVWKSKDDGIWRQAEPEVVLGLPQCTHMYTCTPTKPNT